MTAKIELTYREQYLLRKAIVRETIHIRDTLNNIEGNTVTKTRLIQEQEDYKTIREKLAL